MNTHQKIFFSCAVTFGVVAAAYASSPSQNTAAVIELPRATVVGHRLAPVVELEHSLVIGHRSDVLVASNNGNTSNAAVNE